MYQLLAMNSFFNIFGNKAPKNCKVDLENETDVVDENGFVWVNDETEYVGCRSERSTVVCIFLTMYFITQSQVVCSGFPSFFILLS